MSHEGIALGFDTSKQACSATLLNESSILAHKYEVAQRGQAERLYPLLQELLNDAGAEWGDLSIIGIVTGPGNFTGIRLAVSAARGLSLALSIPAIGIDSFEAASFGINEPCCAIIDGVRNRMFAKQMPDGTPKNDKITELPAPPRGTVIVGGAAAKEAAAHWGYRWTPPLVEASEAAASLASRKKDFDCGRPKPFYLRPPNARPNAKVVSPTGI